MRNVTVTFFGHHDASESLLPTLRKVLAHLIEHRGANRFYIGNQGHFDFLVKRTLDEISVQYPHIQITVVLAYFPVASSIAQKNTILPDGLEAVPPRLAIYKRNEWMLSQADIVVTHVIHPAGGAAIFKEKAEKKNKTVINIK